MSKDEVIIMLTDIWEEVWNIDIPHLTVPEYHKQMEHLMEFIDNLIEEVENKNE